MIEHNAGDLTAVVLRGDARVGASSQRPASRGSRARCSRSTRRATRATRARVVASNASGPLRHRYGSARDLVLGITVALADGTVAKAGGKVIKNVAGYDLAKLFTGSFGSLGSDRGPVAAPAPAAAGHGHGDRHVGRPARAGRAPRST